MIHHKTARQTACNWHGGGGSPLYALCSTGAITANAADEIRQTIAGIHPNRARDLQKLLTYVLRNGPREPMPAWHMLPWPRTKG